jgi:protein-S-isoprenylcysteine O-methyltransferase Ste14
MAMVGGLYRYVRNPMYLAVTATILGQALLLWRPILLAYAAIVAGAFVAFVLGYVAAATRVESGAGRTDVTAPGPNPADLCS